MWDTSGSCTATLTGHQGSIRCLQSWASNGANEAVLSGGDDGVVRLWRSHRKRGRKRLRWACVKLLGHTDAVSCLGLLGGMDMLVSGSLDCSIRFWDLRAVGEIPTSSSTKNRLLAQAPLRSSACHEQQDAVECLCVLPASEPNSSRQSVVTGSESVVLWHVHRS